MDVQRYNKYILKCEYMELSNNIIEVITKYQQR